MFLGDCDWIIYRFILIGAANVNAYKTWQAAFQAFIEQYGHNYTSAYILATEFEEHVTRNRHGTYFLSIGDLK